MRRGAEDNKPSGGCFSTRPFDFLSALWCTLRLTKFRLSLIRAIPLSGQRVSPVARRPFVRLRHPKPNV